MSNISKNFQNKAKRGLKCGAYADGVVPSYEEQAAAMEAEQIAAAKAKFAPQPKPGLMARVFGAARPAPTPAPEPAPAPSVVDTIKNRNNTLRTIANYANGKVPTHVGPGVVDGPGGPREDRVPAMLSDDEAVLPAKTVQALGGPEAVEALIEQTNDGRPPARGLSAGKFANGMYPARGEIIQDGVRTGTARSPAVSKPNWTTPGTQLVQTEPVTRSSTPYQDGVRTPGGAAKGPDWTQPRSMPTGRSTASPGAGPTGPAAYEGVLPGNETAKYDPRMDPNSGRAGPKAAPTGGATYEGTSRPWTEPKAWNRAAGEFGEDVGPALRKLGDRAVATAGRAIDYAKNSRLISGTAKLAGRGALALGAAQSVKNVYDVAKDEDATWVDAVGQAAGEIGKAASSAVGGVFGGTAGAVGGGAGADYVIDAAGGNVAKYAHLPSQRELSKNMTEEDIKRATLDANGAVDVAKYERGYEARKKNGTTYEGGKVTKHALPQEELEAADERGRTVEEGRQAVAALGASAAPTKRTIEDAAIEMLDANRRPRNGYDEEDIKRFTELGRTLGRYGRRHFLNEVHAADANNINAAGHGMTFAANIRGQNINREIGQMQTRATMANNRMGNQWKQLETQADRHSKFLDSQFGPVLNKDGSTNETRQAFDNALQATMAKFGRTHLGQVSDEELRDLMTRYAIVEDAQPGMIRRVLGRATKSPSVHYATPYDVDIEEAKAGVLSPSTKITGVPFGVWTSTVDGSGGLTGTIDGERARVLYGKGDK